MPVRALGQLLVVFVTAVLLAACTGDYEAAHDLASESFRDAFDLERFERVIEEGYPIVTEPGEHTLGHCVARDDRAAVLVQVSADTGDRAILAYELVREGTGWRVAGASPVADLAPTEPPITAWGRSGSQTVRA